MFNMHHTTTQNHFNWPAQGRTQNHHFKFPQHLGKYFPKLQIFFISFSKTKHRITHPFCLKAQKQHPFCKHTTKTQVHDQYTHTSQALAFHKSFSQHSREMETNKPSILVHHP